MQIVFKSPQQQHDFNFPYQLGSGDGMSDPPEAAATFSVPVIEGDIIVAGTDGLFDNVFTDEIARVAMLVRTELPAWVFPSGNYLPIAVSHACCLTRHALRLKTKQGGDTPRKAAQHLAALAQLRASDSEVMSPFGMAAQQVLCFLLQECISSHRAKIILSSCLRPLFLIALQTLPFPHAAVSQWFMEFSGIAR